MRKLFSVLLVLNSAFVFSQDYIDLASLYYKNSPQIEYKGTDAATDIVEYGGSFTLPVKLKSGNAIITGFGYDGVQMNLDTGATTTTFQTMNIRCGMNIVHSDKLKGLYLVIPKYASDIDYFGTNDLQIGGLALLTYKKNSLLNIKFGLAYNNEAFGNFFVPLYGIYYKSANNKFIANIVLPSVADVSYGCSDILRVGINFSGIVNSYYLASNNTENNAYIHRTSNELSGYLLVALKKSILLQTQLGYTIGRGYKAFAIDDKLENVISPFPADDSRTQLNPKLKNGMLVQLKFIYRFYFEEE